jgi:hypothetical protein
MWQDHFFSLRQKHPRLAHALAVLVTIVFRHLCAAAPRMA